VICIVISNNFLSTSKNRDTSLSFAHRSLTNPVLVGILFVMTIDPSKSTTSFASINSVSYFKGEDEVLFSMHTVFRIDDIIPMDDDHRLFQVNLTLTDDNDKDLRIPTDNIREDSEPDVYGWYRLGSVLLRLGEADKAQQVYEVMLEQATTEGQKAGICHQIGWA
jgi:hypothetical protein